jgi:RNA polymerase sigma-70 factor (ECF subfamily)
MSLALAGLQTSPVKSYYRRALNPTPRFEFDRDYVVRLADGDAATEQHFTRYFGDLLTAKLRRRLRSAAQVEDVKQETFVRVITTLRRNGLASPGSLGAYVNTVANNIVFELFRSQSRTVSYDPQEQPEPVADGPSAESTLIERDDARRVRAVLEDLPQKDRDVLRALFFEECDKDEVCRRFRVDRNYLRVLVHRAKARFRTEFIGRLENA